MSQLKLNYCYLLFVALVSLSAVAIPIDDSIDDSIEGASRWGVGGIPINEKPQNYHGFAQDFQRPNNGFPGRGNLVHIGQKIVLGSGKGIDQMNAPHQNNEGILGSIIPSVFQGQKPARYINPAPLKYDPSKPVEAPNGRPYVDDSKYKHIKNIAGGDLAVLEREVGGWGKQKNNINLPRLEKDRNNMGKNCFMHTWGTAGGSRAGGLAKEHQYIKLPVTPSGCQNGKCTMKVNGNGKFCDHHGDQAAPIFCDNKLTWVAGQGQYGNGRRKRQANRCTDTISAVHSADIIKDIRHYATDIQTS